MVRAVKAVDGIDRNIGSKIFRKYGSCLIEYFYNVPRFSYLKDDVWTIVKPSQYSSL